MTILAATPGSVLWLLSGDEGAHRRLREAARTSGVDPERLIFAPKAGNARHLARIALADLFLDTFPYGAHSTGADAITMGLPVLTVPGKSFAARFCASIVAAAGTPQMICATPAEYTTRAIAFANDRESLAAVGKALQEQRETCALRDIPALARRLEELFWQMQSEAERGETPVPDLRNLDVYYEVGAELVLADAGFEDDRAYRARYAAKLARWNEREPLWPDSRLWRPAP
jgi:predicted O-linked N-acetylglucosamine transferase (SPINDLY family)